jgi:hypothetical protein
MGHAVGVADDINGFNYARYRNFSIVIRKRKSKIGIDTDEDHKDQPAFEKRLRGSTPNDNEGHYFLNK